MLMYTKTVLEPMYNAAHGHLKAQLKQAQAHPWWPTSIA